MSTLSYGLNITKKPPLSQRSHTAKRKTIFDDDSGPEDGPDSEENPETISSIGGPQSSKATPSRPNARSSNAPPPSRSSKPPKISRYGDLSTNHTTQRHSKSAQEIDASIYDYDAAYDSIHSTSNAKPSADTAADAEKRPKYMSSLLAAAEVRKRDQLRAKEKMLAKEREAEGDEFADKEKFVTGAYKRQQEEMRRLEEEEKEREREAEERKRREGGGMKALYKNLLDRDEERHRSVMKAVEEGKGKEDVKEKKEEKEAATNEKSEEQLAREMGVTINEDGMVVDKRQLLGAGLNAGNAPKARPAADPRRSSGHGRGESARQRESRLFEEKVLGKRSASPGDRESRAAKSRKMEDELLAAMGSP